MMQDRRLEIGSSVLDIGCSQLIEKAASVYREFNVTDELNVKYRTRNVQ